PADHHGDQDVESDDPVEQGVPAGGRCRLMRVIRATCSMCGQQAETEEVPLTWLTSVENGRKLVYCDRCTRENVRNIEGKLDSVYW
ncbi:hypothetical protein ACWCOV_09695, partial [Kribbella sp. NPDC002412]